MLRIVSGTVGGLRLKTPKNVEIRPTQDRIKQVIFNSLIEAIEGAEVLDLFAGTGSLGLESLSRGAARAVFVEKEARCVASVTDNVALCGFAAQSRIVKMDVYEYLSHWQGETYDIVFADPPYEKIRSSLDESPFLEAVRPWVKPGGLFVWEHFSAQKLREPKSWTIVRDRDYGETGLTFLRPEPACSKDVSK